MRITQRMMTRNYLDRMNKNLSNLAKSNERMSSQTRYNRVSENTADVARSFGVREQLYKNQQFTTNIRNAQGELASVESSLMIVNESLRTVTDRVLQAANGTIPENEKQLIAREITSLQEQLLQITNSKYGEKYLFAGSGNGEAPYTKNADGKLLFNGYPVNELVANPSTGKPSVMTPGSPPTYADISYNKDVYLDIGLGMVMKGTGISSELDTKSALRISNSGLDCFGYGIDNNGLPNDVYSLLGKIAGDIAGNNIAELDKDMDKLKLVTDALLMNITDVGVRSTFLEDTWNRLDAESITLKTEQQKLESMPLEEEAIYNKSFEMSWMVTLQLGSKIIPPSIFDFIR